MDNTFSFEDEKNAAKIPKKKKKSQENRGHFAGRIVIACRLLLASKSETNSDLSTVSRVLDLL